MGVISLIFTDRRNALLKIKEVTDWHHLGTVPRAALIGAVTILIAFSTLFLLEGTFGEDLDYTEPI